MGSSLGRLEWVSHTHYISLQATMVQFQIRRGHWKLKKHRQLFYSVRVSLDLK